MRSRDITNADQANRIMAELTASGPTTADALAKIIGLSRTSTTLCLRSLHKKQVVANDRRDRQDRRLWTLVEPAVAVNHLPAIQATGVEDVNDAEHLAWMSYWRQRRVQRLGRPHPQPHPPEQRP